MRLTLVLCFLVWIAAPANAQQHVIRGFDNASELFWEALYPEEGETVYCAHTFSGKAPGLQIEHVVPASVIAQHFGCESRECDIEAYLYAEADLHNLQPVYGRANGSRSDVPFSELEVGERRICPLLERTYGEGATVEPRAQVKGDIARALFYMERSYGISIREGREMLKRWSREDPMTNAELWRARLIDVIQGTHYLEVLGRD